MNIKSMLNELIEDEQYIPYMGGKGDEVINVSVFAGFLKSLDGMSLAPDEPTEEIISSIELATKETVLLKFGTWGRLYPDIIKAINTTRDKDQ